MVVWKVEGFAPLPGAKVSTLGTLRCSFGPPDNRADY